MSRTREQSAQHPQLRMLLLLLLLCTGAECCSCHVTASSQCVDVVGGHGGVAAQLEVTDAAGPCRQPPQAARTRFTPEHDAGGAPRPQQRVPRLARAAVRAQRICCTTRSNTTLSSSGGSSGSSAPPAAAAGCCCTPPAPSMPLCAGAGLAAWCSSSSSVHAGVGITQPTAAKPDARPGHACAGEPPAALQMGPPAHQLLLPGKEYQTSHGSRLRPRGACSSAALHSSSVGCCLAGRTRARAAGTARRCESVAEKDHRRRGRLARQAKEATAPLRHSTQVVMGCTQSTLPSPGVWWQFKHPGLAVQRPPSPIVRAATPQHCSTAATSQPRLSQPARAMSAKPAPQKESRKEQPPADAEQAPANAAGSSGNAGADFLPSTSFTGTQRCSSEA